MKTKSRLLMLISLLAIAACNREGPVSLEEIWANKLAGYHAAIDDAAAKVEGVEDFSEVLGPGKRMVQGNGTFIGDGVGTANLAGVGVVTGEVSGIVKILGTREVETSGLEYTGTQGDFRIYQGDGFFTATSDVAQHIEVTVDGDCWVVGSGTGMVMFSGDGWAFWYQ